MLSHMKIYNLGNFFFCQISQCMYTNIQMEF